VNYTPLANMVNLIDRIVITISKLHVQPLPQTNNSRPMVISAACMVVSFGLIWLTRQVSLYGLVNQTIVAPLHLLIGAFGCTWCAVITLKSEGWLGRIALGISGVCTLWFSLFVGVATHFDVWQAIPNPPSEAFADGAQLIGSVLVGWVPGVFLYFSALATAWAIRRLRSRREASG
jgi:hypothetical protein